MPSVSAGWGTNSYTAKADASIWGVEAVSEGDNAESQSWYVGLQWPDVFLQGNYLGTAVGQPTFISSNDSFLESDESTFAWEIWYKFQVTDNIAVTPAYFFIDNPSGYGQWRLRPRRRAQDHLHLLIESHQRFVSKGPLLTPLFTHKLGPFGPLFYGQI